MIEIVLHEKPVSWSAPLVTQKGIHYNPKNKEKRETISQIQAWASRNASFTPGYIFVVFIFEFAPPKSASKKDRKLMLQGEIIPTKCDCTNLQKFYEDCIKNILIEDDRMVAQIFSEKRYAEKDKVIIKIYTLQEWKDAIIERKVQESHR